LGSISKTELTLSLGSKNEKSNLKGLSDLSRPSLGATLMSNMSLSLFSKSSLSKTCQFKSTDLIPVFYILISLVTGSVLTIVVGRGRIGGLDR
jgi:hypothetical protein